MPRPVCPPIAADVIAEIGDQYRADRAAQFSLRMGDSRRLRRRRRDGRGCRRARVARGNLARGRAARAARRLLASRPRSARPDRQRWSTSDARMASRAPPTTRRESACSRPTRRPRRLRSITPRFSPTTCASSAPASCPRPGAVSEPPPLSPRTIFLAHDLARQALDAIEGLVKLLARGRVREPHVVGRVEVVAADDRDLRVVEDDRGQAVAVADRRSLVLAL